LETQIFEKKAIFPVKERFWPIFNHIIEYDEPQGIFCMDPQGILAITIEVIRSNI